MVWVVKMTGADGAEFYGSAPDRDDLRYTCFKAVDAEKFETKESAEAVFYQFHQIIEFKKYVLEAVQI